MKNRPSSSLERATLKRVTELYDEFNEFTVKLDSCRDFCYVNYEGEILPAMLVSYSIDTPDKILQKVFEHYKNLREQDLTVDIATDQAIECLEKLCLFKVNVSVLFRKEMKTREIEIKPEKVLPNNETTRVLLLKE